VCIPGNLPLYGSYLLPGLEVEIRISDNSVEMPITLIAILAHEFAHVLLRSLMHPAGDNEIYTDLTAMIAGFSEVMRYGRKSERVSVGPRGQVTHTTTYGYLTDPQFDYAYGRITGLLSKHQVLKNAVLSRAKGLTQKCRKIQETLNEFRGLLGRLDSHLQRRVRKRDAVKLVQLHQPGRTEETEGVIKAALQAASAASEGAGGITLYTDNSLAMLAQYAEGVEEAAQSVAGEHVRLFNDCGTIKRNLSVYERLGILIGQLGFFPHKEP